MPHEGHCCRRDPAGAAHRHSTSGNWARLVRGLARHSAVLVLDCGPGLGDPGARAVMATADQVVVLAEPYPSQASRWLAQTLVDNGLPVVVVPTRASPRLDTAALAGHLPGVRGVVPLAHHPAGQAGPPPSGTGVPTSWQAQARRLAELLVADWTALGIGDTPADGARLPREPVMDSAPQAAPSRSCGAAACAPPTAATRSP